MNFLKYYVDVVWLLQSCCKPWHLQDEPQRAVWNTI